MTQENDPNKWMAGEIFKVLSGLGHKVYMYDSNGARVFDPKEADRLFSRDASLMVTLGYTQGKPAQPHVVFHPSQATDPNIVEDLKQTLKAQNKYGHSFTTSPFAKTLEPKHFAWMNRAKERVTESNWTGTTRTSRQRVGMTEVVIRHNQRLDDSDNARRWTRIAEIFLHGKDGSRYRFPFRHILGARAMAQHIDQGHAPWDQDGEVIEDILTAVMQLRKLRRWANVNRPDCVDHVIDAQQQVKNVLERLTSTGHYTAGMEQARNLCQTWRDAAPPVDVFPDNVTLAVAAVPHLHAPPKDGIEPLLTKDPIHTMFKEARELELWFDQFEIKKIYEDQQTTDVMAASQETDSTDPRTVLDNLNHNVVGWSSRFEENPMEVLNQIDDILDQIRKLQD